MRSHVILAVFKRNVASYFSGVLGYLFIVVFVVAAAALAYTPQFFANNLANLDQLNEMFPLLLLFIVPAITMGAWSEERKLGTEELLFTLPAGDFEIVLGKYLAVLAVYTIALLFSVFQLFVLGWYADPDWGLLLTTYLGYWLSGATLLSAGMFASALTSNATVAFVLGAAICAIPVFIGSIPGVAEYAPVLRELSLSEQFREFAQGTIPLNGVLYFISFTAFMLYLNLVLISKRHWSGDQQTNMGLQFLVRTLCLIVILVSLNIVSRASADVMNLRLDMTAEKSFTLSKTTTDLLDSLDEKRPVTIQAFVSNEVPREYVALRKRLIGLLRQYDRIGGAQVDVRIVEVEPFSTEAEEAASFGIEKRQVQTEQGGRFAISDVYLGAVITSPFDEVILPFIDLSTPVEYELTRSVRTVSNRKRRTVGVLDTDADVMGGFDQTAFHNLPGWQIIDELRKQYDVSEVDPGQAYDEQRQLFRLESDEEAEFSVTDLVPQLEEGDLPEAVRGEYAGQSIPLSNDVKVTALEAGTKWQVEDADSGHRSKLILSGDQLTAYGEFDVVLAVLPSSLNQDQMGRLVAYIEAGNPAVIFDDPMPVTVGLQHAPSLPKRPPGGPFNRNSPPPEPRADGGKATSLMNALGLRWDSDDKQPSERELVVVWDNFNPHPKIAQLVPPEFVFISPESGLRSAFSRDSRITEGFQQMLALFPGRVRPIAGTELEHDWLLRTSKDSGEFKFSELVETGNPFFGPQMKRGVPHLQDDEAHAIAVHVQEKSGDEDSGDEEQEQGGLNVVYVADVDLISNYVLFSLEDVLRRGFDYELKINNLAFVMNAIDLVAGDVENVDLRNREARPRPLSEIQREINKFREARQEKEEEAEEKAKEELKKAQARLDEAQEKIKQDKQLDQFEQAQQLLTAAEAETSQLNKIKKEIEREKEQTIDQLKAQEQRQVRALQNQIRWQAVLLPPIPAVLLGLIVLGTRLYRERSEIDPKRRVSR